METQQLAKVERLSPLRRWVRFVLVRLCVLLVGGTFIVSGFSKALDPQGMCLKLQAYGAAWGWHVSPDALPVRTATGLLAIVEFLLGIYLLLGIRRYFATRFTLLLTLALTLLTTYIYIYSPVADCGCFGAILTLSNGQTLAKNVVLLFGSLYLCFRCRDIRRLVSEKNQWGASIWSFLFVCGLTLWTYHYLPRADFAPFSVGTDLRKALETGQDEQVASFYALTAEGEDATLALATDTGRTFLLTLPDIPRADDGNNDRLNDLHDLCADRHWQFYALTAEGQDFSQWNDRTGATYPVLVADESQLRALARSNHGLVMLHDGKVVAKWSCNNLPETEADIAAAEKQQKEQTRWDAIKHLATLYLLPLIIWLLLDNLYVGSRFLKHWHIRRKIKLKIQTHKTTLNKQQSMRKKIVAGNWKMNKNLQEGVALAKELNEVLTADRPNCGVVICTPFIHLATVSGLIDHSVIGLGAENCADKASGAYTGEVSAEMVKSTGAEYVILGHSERRAYYGETPEILKEKVNLALENGLKVIFCIGEVLEEREAGKQNEVVKAQLEGSLFDLTAEQFANVVLAYEPVWAIGTGKTATADQAEEMHAFIRATIAEKFGAEAAENTTILYGGSCKPSNARELFAKPDVDGGLIGGASLKAPDFKGIIDAWK